MSGPILNISGLECGYGKNAVLRGVDLSVAKGEIVGVIGPNAAGKTTLLRAVTKIVPLLKGDIKLEDRPVKELTRQDIAKKVAIVSQVRENMFFNITVEEAVLLGRLPHFSKYQWLEKKEDMAIAEKAMELTDVIALRKRSLEDLSGGERQRVFLARAIAQEPELLLLDEPTSYLDITHQVAILDLIRRLNREKGLTVVMVMHDLNLASEYCNKIVLLNKGSVYKVGKPEEVIDYKVIEEVYKTVVVVKKNPVSSKPYVFVASEEDKRKRK